MIRVILACFAVSVLSGCELTQQAASMGTSGREAKAVVKGYMEEILNRDDWEAWDKYFHRTIDFNGELLERVELQRRVASFRSAYPDFQVTIEEQIAEGNKVVTRVTCTGTHLGTDEGVAATGKRVRYTGIAIDRIKDGKIIEMRFLGDVWGRLKQIKRDM